MRPDGGAHDGTCCSLCYTGGFLTREQFVLKYGEEEGTEKWDE
eukprot:gene27141-22250_t